MIISTEQLEKLHQVELKALLKFDQVCRKYNLQYTLDGGTLLGAIRHKVPFTRNLSYVYL